MSATLTPPTTDADATQGSPPGQRPPVRPSPPDEPGPGGTASHASIPGTCLAAAVAAAGAAFALGSLFEGLLAAVLGLLGAAGGAAWVAGSLRAGRPSVVQWGAVPAALLLGAVAALALGGTAGGTLPGVIEDALFSGGLSQPPVPFDPGWRFLVASVSFLLGVGSASVALSYDRPNLSVAAATPVVALAVVAQPADAGPRAVIGGLLGIVGGLVVAHGVEVGMQDQEGGFHPRRLVRGIAAVAALGVAMPLIAIAGSSLLPEESDTQVIPPMRPPVSSPQEDRELFVVEASRALPWRLGVLDVYRDGAWMTPPFDVARFTTVPDKSSTTDTVAVTFRITDLPGRSLPTLASPTRIASEGGEILIDPRTGALRFERLVTGSVAYTVEAPPPAGTQELVAAPDPGPELEPFLDVPPAPSAVRGLLADIGATASSFERLQAVRQVWYDTVIAAGAGDPVDVPPARVEDILTGVGGSEASPYEIVAGEALLARWAGVPSRIGYGWFGGDELDDGTRSVRPRHGSAWLEVWFEGSGWVPIVGKPPRARGSLSDAPQNEDAAVRPTDELAVITYVPIRRQTVTLLFEVVRYWTVRVVPVVVVGALLLLFGPIARRAWRRRRWGRWAGATGRPAARMLVTYARLRDRAWDLNIGHPTQTPLEFAGALRPDDEHRELAWLVTRALWGDLAEAVDDDVVDDVRRMAASIERRMVAAQPATARVIAAASRASLQQPFALEAHEATVWRPRLRVPSRVKRVAVAASALLVLGSCGEALDLAAAPEREVLPEVLVPARLDDFTFQREPDAEVAFEEGGPDALVDHGRVFTVRQGDAVEASLQLAALKPGLADRFEDVREGILEELGQGRFSPIRIGEERALAVTTNSQRLLLWFSPDGDWYQLMVARTSFDEADAVFAAVLAAQRGQPVESIDDIGQVQRIDPRRGIPS